MMARINPPPTPSFLTRIINTGLKRRYGKPFPALALMGHHRQYPLAYAVFSSIFGLAKTRLDPEIKRLATQLVAELNGCSFCIDLGRRLAQDEKLDLQRFQDLHDFNTSQAYTDAEKAALQYAFEATQVGARVADDTFSQLTNFFDDREIMELTIAVASENFYNRVNAPLAVESQGFCSLPPVSRPAKSMV